MVTGYYAFFSRGGLIPSYLLIMAKFLKNTDAVSFRMEVIYIERYRRFLE